jgi:hypothetical protein
VVEYMQLTEHLQKGTMMTFIAIYLWLLATIHFVADGSSKGHRTTLAVFLTYSTWPVMLPIFLVAAIIEAKRANDAKR